jgi:hypothetical protein
MATPVVFSTETLKMLSENNKAQELLRKRLTLPSNEYCADCWAKDVHWGSLTYGVFLCSTCAQAHKQLKAELKSIKLDFWTLEEAERMARNSNEEVNRLYFSAEENCLRGENYWISGISFFYDKYVGRKWCRIAP